MAVSHSWAVTRSRWATRSAGLMTLATAMSDVLLEANAGGAGNLLALEFGPLAQRHGGVDAHLGLVDVEVVTWEAHRLRHHERALVGPAAGGEGPQHVLAAVDVHVVV